MNILIGIAGGILLTLVICALIGWKASLDSYEEWRKDNE